MDCRINAYPDYIGFGNINRQPPNFLFIDQDLDKSAVKTEKSSKIAVERTCKNIKIILGGHPTVLWTGNGVHIYQPVNGIILELESIFAQFHQPSQGFLKFAARRLSNNKSDPTNNPAFRSCLVRIPGTHNFKCVQQNSGIADSNTEIKVIRCWDGNRPNINPLLYEYYLYLADAKINSTKSIRSKGERQNKTTSKSWGWIEELLHKPLPDFRKLVTHYVLSRYLVNVKQLSQKEANCVVMEWLTKCNQIERLRPPLRDFGKRVAYDVKEAGRTQKLPIGKDLLRDTNNDLYVLLFGSRVPT